MERRDDLWLYLECLDDEDLAQRQRLKQRGASRKPVQRLSSSFLAICLAYNLSQLSTRPSAPIFALTRYGTRHGRVARHVRCRFLRF
jgi:hypothetical protein